MNSEFENQIVRQAVRQIINFYEDELKTSRTKVEEIFKKRKSDFVKSDDAPDKKRRKTLMDTEEDTEERTREYLEKEIMRLTHDLDLAKKELSVSQVHQQGDD